MKLILVQFVLFSELIFEIHNEYELVTDFFLMGSNIVLPEILQRTGRLLPGRFTETGNRNQERAHERQWAYGKLQVGTLYKAIDSDKCNAGPWNMLNLLEMGVVRNLLISLSRWEFLNKNTLRFESFEQYEYRIFFYSENNQWCVLLC